MEFRIEALQQGQHKAPPRIIAPPAETADPRLLAIESPSRPEIPRFAFDEDDSFPPRLRMCPRCGGRGTWSPADQTARSRVRRARLCCRDTCARPGRAHDRAGPSNGARTLYLAAPAREEAPMPRPAKGSRHGRLWHRGVAADGSCWHPAGAAMKLDGGWREDAALLLRMARVRLEWRVPPAVGGQRLPSHGPTGHRGTQMGRLVGAPGDSLLAWPPPTAGPDAVANGRGPRRLRPDRHRLIATR